MGGSKIFPLPGVCVCIVLSDDKYSLRLDVCLPGHSTAVDCPGARFVCVWRCIRDEGG